MVRRTVSFLLAFGMFWTPVMAEPTPSPETEEVPEEPVGEEPQEVIDISTEYAVLIDADSGKVLYEKNSSEHADPASLTKLMTVYLAVNHLDSHADLTMSSAAFQSYDHSQGVLWIQEGETLSAEDCEYATMLASANDTCAMLAEGVSGSIDSFVSQMNSEASSMGLENTHFSNPFGLADTENYSSAYDLAVLTRTALKNDAFKTIFSAPSYNMKPTNMQAQSRVIAADCQLIRSGDYSYEDAVGGKIGSTYANGYALTALARRGATSLIAVVLAEEDADTAYHDIVRIFEYGFSSAQTVTITAEDVGTKTIAVKSGRKYIADVVFTSSSSYSILLPKELDSSELKAEIEVKNEDSSNPEDITAEVIFTLGGETIGTSPMERTIILKSEEEAHGKMNTSQTVFDWISVGTLAVVILLPLVIDFFRQLEPPK